MSSRIRNNIEHIFEFFCVVECLKRGKEAAITKMYPEDYKNDAILKWVPTFTFPCSVDANMVQHFSFVLTGMDSTWTYGFCRHEPETLRALVIVSHFPYHDAFHELLDYVANIFNTSGYATETLRPKTDAKMIDSVAPAVADHLKKFYLKSSPIPLLHRLPTLPDNINITEYYCACNFLTMIEVQAALLHERRIIMVSRKLSRLSACVQAAGQLLYPMEWQSIYIPVLPASLKDYLLAPMPYLIGVPKQVYDTLVLADIGDIVTVQLDESSVSSPYDDSASLPEEVVEDLLYSLESCKNIVGDSLSRAFLRALVHLLGGLESAITCNVGSSEPHFNKEIFIHSRGSSMRVFLEKMLSLQMFQQFLEGRLAMVANKTSSSDEFTRECCSWDVMYKKRREERLRRQRNPARLLESLKQKTQPAMESALKTVRSGNKGMKSAYKGLKNKLVQAKRNIENSRKEKAGTSIDFPSFFLETPLQSQPAVGPPPRAGGSTQVSTTLLSFDDDTSSENSASHLGSQAPKDMATSSNQEVVNLLQAEDDFFLLDTKEPRIFSDFEDSDSFSGHPDGDMDPQQSVVLRKSEIAYQRRLTDSSLLAELLKTANESRSPEIKVNMGGGVNTLQSYHPLPRCLLPAKPERLAPKVEPRVAPSLVSPLVLAGMADSDDATPRSSRLQEDELLQQYGINFEKFRVSRQNWTKFE